MFVKVFLFVWMIPAFSGNMDDSDHVLKQHFKAHSQEDWNLFESLTAKGEWHIGPRMIYVDYQMKSPNKLAARSQKGKEALVSNQLYAGIKGLDETSKKGLAFGPDVALALSFVWPFGSPLASIEDQLTKKEDVQVDKEICHWYQQKLNKYTFDFFIRKTDKLFYKVTITDEKEVVVGTTTMKQYRKFGPYHLPSQVEVKTAELDYLLVFTDYVIGDYVTNDAFILTK
jgi:hypothetical protein